MRIKQLIVLVVTILCFWLAHAGINNVCASCNTCNNENVVATKDDKPTELKAATTNKQPKKVQPIIFNWDKPEGLTSSQFEIYRDSIAKTLNDDQIIEVFGYYFKAESTPDGYDNMGFARADFLIEKLSETISIEKMQARAQLIPEVGGVRTAPFISTNTRFIDAPKALTSDKESNKDIARVDQVGGRALIYFPFNSTKKITNQEIDDYLDQLAKQIIQSNEQVYITGHTDDVGSEVSNIGIGRARARAIRDILQKKGVPKRQIIIDSKGKSEPTAPNNSTANRALNRRVEVEIQ